MKNLNRNEKIVAGAIIGGYLYGTTEHLSLLIQSMGQLPNDNFQRESDSLATKIEGLFSELDIGDSPYMDFDVYYYGGLPVMAMSVWEEMASTKQATIFRCMLDWHNAISSYSVKLSSQVSISSMATSLSFSLPYQEDSNTGIYQFRKL